MAVKLLDLRPYIDRLKVEVPDLQGRVYGAANAAAAYAHGRPRAMPSAYLIDFDDDPKPNQLDTGLLQQVTAHIVILLAMRNVADPTGEDNGEEIKLLRQQIHEALLYWTPDDSFYTPMEWHRGKLNRFEHGVLWWEEILKTQFYVRK